MRMGQSYEPKIYITSGLLVVLLRHSLGFTSAFTVPSFFFCLSTTLNSAVNYPALTDGASSPRDEDSFILPGNLLYTPSEKGMYSRGSLSTDSRGSPDPHEEYLEKHSSNLPSPPSYQLFQPCRRGSS